MLRKYMLLMVVALVPAISALAGDGSPWQTELPFKKATIEYQITGMENGTETLYIRDHGAETARYRSTIMQVMGVKNITETIQFVSPEYIYSYDLQEQNGTKSVNPQKYMMEEYEKLSTAEKKQVMENSRKIGSNPMLGAMGGKVEEKAATILGYECDKMSAMGTTVYSIHKVGLPLKTETNMMGMEMVMEALSIERGKAPKKYFDHPQGITPVMDPQAEAMARSMARDMMATLKDPDLANRPPSRMAAPQLPNMKGQPQLSPEDEKAMQEAMEAMKKMLEN